jgi:hypothetical protein
MKYFHELSEEELKSLENKTVGYVMDNYKQPDWCNYPRALSWGLGCWDLCSLDYPSVISKESCKTCDCFKL